MHYDDRIKLDTFKGLTTYSEDYRKYPPQEREIYRWPKDTTEPVPKKCAQYVAEDHETFQPWEKDKYVPFNLLWIPAPITRTNPWKPINKNPEKPVDTGKQEAIRTRPRLYMSPAVSIDDVADKDMRKVLCDNMYTTDWRRSEREAVAYVNMTKREIGDSLLEAGNPFQLSADLYPPLPDKWRNLSEKWDRRQKRHCVDPTKMFWLHSEIKNEENPLERLVPQETKREIAELIKEDKLRQPHDMYSSGYTGYRVHLPKGVSLAKNDFPVVHPELSVAQAIAKRNRGDS